MSIHTTRRKHLSRLVARLRLQRLDTERAAILAAFPELMSSPTAQAQVRTTNGRRGSADRGASPFAYGVSIH